jgi:hypothetical protein
MSCMSELNKKMQNLIQISSQENRLIKLVEHFYESLTNIKEFIGIINSKSDISIRLIDYFVTKYSKKNKISYKIDNNTFNIHQSYKQQLKNFQKKNFDPFARGIRIPYYIGNIWIITTIGQLNFYQWFISNKILEYIIKNKEAIEFDMNKNKKNKVDIKIKKPKNIYKKIETNIIQQSYINPQQQIKNKNTNTITVTF